jgi:hypothetical protein
MNRKFLKNTNLFEKKQNASHIRPILNNFSRMKKFISINLLILSFTFIYLSSNAQEAKPDTLTRVIEQLQSDVAILKNLKITGYIQAQVQFADSTGAKTSMAGGDFPAGSDKRFSVRRGRLKFVYAINPLSQAALQIDVTETGVKTKEVYAKFTDPFIHWFSLTAGLQNRPFGYEVEYSSGNLESPERARMNQSLFKDEYDLGAMLTIQPPKTSRFNFLKLDAGFFTGSIENNSPMDYKRVKDFIGRINFTKTFADEKIKLSGDVSYYNGHVPINSTKLYKIQDIDNSPTFYLKTVDSLSNVLREYYGADLQFALTSPIGLTILRGEFTQGQQVSGKSDIKNPVALAGGLYVRHVQGYYIMFVQNIAQTRHSIVIKYDVFDPNTKASGTQLTDASAFTSQDVKYSDLGLGYTCRINPNTKLVVYYDINKNENTGLKGYTKDLKDNVWTIRLQYKF